MAMINLRLYRYIMRPSSCATTYDRLTCNKLTDYASKSRYLSRSKKNDLVCNIRLDMISICAYMVCIPKFIPIILHHAQLSLIHIIRLF
jgi:hypothetical protein